jgi:hypothetical protein
MTEFQQLLIGGVLVIAGLGVLLVSLPRHGKKAWFVKVPFLEPTMSILIISGFAVGLILIIAHFTTIDDATIGGVAKHL